MNGASCLINPYERDESNIIKRYHTKTDKIEPVSTKCYRSCLNGIRV